jgi:adenosylcobinamide kinase/adenosylcobinamide-phosphate guanylyltransferase
MTTGKSILVLGGARSGKSRLAQRRAEEIGGELIYVATAEPLDDEMVERIARHRADRDGRWRTIECPLALAETIVREQGDGRVLLIDCLTLWLSNLMHAERDIMAATNALAEALGQARGTIILVANEVGLGLVPDNSLGRRFRDEAGRLNQSIATAASEVLFVAAGLALQLK